MKKTLKILSILLGLFVVLPILIISIALLVIDPNEYKPQIESLVEENTGREFQIEGNLALSVFPWLGVEIGQMTLGNAQGFEQAAFAKIAQAEVKVHLVPLFSKEVEVSAITLNGFELNLAKNKEGTTNWDDLIQKDPQTEQTSPTGSETKQPKKDAASSATPIAALAIGGLQINNATINWQDDTTDTHYKIEDMMVTTGAVSLGKPIDVQLSLAVSMNQPPLNTNIQFAANIEPDLNNIHHRINGAELTIDFDAKEPAANGNLTLATDVAINMETRDIKLSPLTFSVDIKDQTSGIHTQGTINTVVDYNLANEQLALNDIALDFLSKDGPLSNEGVRLRSTTGINIDLKQQTLNIDQFNLNLADQLKANASLSGTQIIDKPRLKGQLNIPPFNPRELLLALGQTPPETQDSNVLQSSDLAVKVNARQGRIKIEELTIHLDDTTLKSYYIINDPDDPHIKFNVAIDQINVDRYLPPVEEQPEVVAPPPPEAIPPSEPLDLEPLRQLDLDGQITVDKLVASNLKFNKINTTVKAKDGLINIYPLKIKLYDGNYRGNIQLNAQGEELVTSLNEKLTGIQAGPLLKDLIDNDMLEGKGDVSMELTATGDNGDEIMNSLAGNVGIIFKNGAINGYNIGHILREAKARLKGKKLSADEKTVKTDFAELSATLDLKDGIANNQDLLMKSPLLRVTGKGKVNYVEQNLNYVATTTIVGTSKGQGGKELEDLKGLPLDIKIKGPFTDPKFDVDIAAALKAKAKAKAKAKLEAAKAKQKEKVEKAKQEAKQEAKEKLEEEKERAKEKIEDELKDKLKKLF